jgi:alpha-glucosidase
MVWEAEAENAGFSTARPWLPVPLAHRGRAVDIQDGEGGSVLAAYRSILALRKRHPALIRGSVRFLDAEGDVLAFLREHEDERLLCVFNFAAEPAKWALPAEIRDVEMTALAVDVAGVLGGVVEESVLALPPLGSFVGRIG